MSFVQFKKHRVFRETESVIFYDISVEDSNASDLVVHTGPAISPPDDIVGAKQFYIHYHQTDHNRVLSGTRTFELVNLSWKFPYHIVHLNRQSGALIIPPQTFHRSVSGEDGSIVINQAIRDDEFDPEKEFSEVSSGQNSELIMFSHMRNQLSITCRSLKTTLTIDDDGVLTFPPGILEATGWKEGDMLEWIDREDGSFELRKVNES